MKNYGLEDQNSKNRINFYGIKCSMYEQLITDAGG